MSIIDFNSTKCRHCYKCVRNCEIKAISVLGGRAVILEDHCVLCGHCLAVCPQEAKTLTSELGQVKAMLRSGERVAAQLAPLYMGLMDYQTIGQVRSALLKLGFADVFETAEGAAAVTEEYLRLIDAGEMDNIITTCCPAVNDLIEMYHPSLVPLLAPVVSPMIASGRIIKQRLGQDTRVVFIGPCIAKRKEAKDPRHDHDVDAVISFSDLKQWLKEESICIRDCEDEPFPFDPAVNRRYPVTGGVLASVQAGLRDRPENRYRQLYVHGLHNCIELCHDLEEGSLHHCIIEMNSCENGCVKGPALSKEGVYPYKIKLDIEDAIPTEAPEESALRRSMANVSFGKKFENRALRDLMPDEEEIRSILAKTGKFSAEDELNCGACGYPSCREKAIAVFQGKAELEMCIPFLTTQAESMANTILKESPNAVIIADAAQRILEYSDVGERFFGVKREQALKMFLVELIDPTDSENVYMTHKNIYGKKVYYEQYDLWTHQNIVYIPKLDCTLMTLIDITAEEKRLQQELERRNATVEMAQNVLRSQMFNAQKIAGLLGEATAVTKMTLTKLVRSMQENSFEEIEEENMSALIAGPDGAENSETAFLDGLDGLSVTKPAGKPKLKINTQYAKPAQEAPAENVEQRYAAADKV